MNIKRFIAILLMLLFEAGLLLATDRFVSVSGTNNPPYTNWPDAATNIIAAVNICANGDSVYVSNGTYAITGSINVAKSLTLTGVAGRNNTIINGNYPYYTNRCVNIAATGIVVDGFTIMNGYASPGQGGGVYDAGWGAIIRNCLVASNQSYNGGGGAAGAGIYSVGGLISNCIINGNTALNKNGGGVYLSEGIMRDCAVYNNTALTNGGGGIIADSGSIVERCIVERNMAASSYGGGLYLVTGSAASPIIRDCLIIGNSAASIGGGLLSYNIGNYGGYVGNCTIVSNQGSSGGGICMGGGYTNSFFYNCVIVSNTATGSGPDIYASVADANYLFNCNTPSTNRFICVNTVTNAPLFVGYPNYNFRLTSGSPCINAGTNQSWMNGAVDLDGYHRLDIFSGQVDIGCYEFLPPGMMFRGF